MQKKSVNLKEFINKFDKVSIYGAGDYARFTYLKLNQYNIEIDAFIVTEEMDKKEMFSIPIVSYQNWKKSDFSRNIIIGVSTKYQSEIISILENEEYNIYCVDSEDFIDKCISILDTSISDDNHGNEIIMEAVYLVSNNIFSDCFITKLPFIDNLSEYGKKLLNRSEIVLLGGTNSLCSHMQTEPSFGVNNENADLYENKIVLAGVGWYKYEDDPDEYTKNLLLKVLSKDFIHSVRDKYTENKLRGMGINNVITTGCLTTWEFDKYLSKDFPAKKGKDAIVMFTPYGSKRDEHIIKIVQNNYENIYYWPQSPLDSLYVKTLCPEAIKIDSSLTALDSFLCSHDSIDYIGTRLHGGIRCLQHHKRAFIFAIDNRAEEMGKDLNLPIVKENEIEKLNELVCEKYDFKVTIPNEKIKKWKRQFENIL